MGKTIGEYAGLPLELNELTGELSFHDGLCCDGSSEKRLGQMTGLFRCPDGADENKLVYRAYRNIRFKKDEPVFEKTGLRYDITVVLPGTVNGEFHKTSGHYHGFPVNKAVPYPEVYEVIAGEIVFVLQKNTGFERPDQGRIEAVKAVHVKAGEAVIIPPWYGHGSVNVAGRVSAFSNIAAAACPLFYEPVKMRHGLAAYILESRAAEIPFEAAANSHYESLPAIETIRPEENTQLGIRFGTPCYRNFITGPEQYDFMLHPEKYTDQMELMIKEQQEKGR